MTRRDAGCFSFEQRVSGFVTSEAVLAPGETVLLMLSGGADSMALLALLLAVGGKLGVAGSLGALHVDYALRGAASDRDRELVVRACAAAGIPLTVVKLPRRPAGADFQARARTLRYDHARDLAAAERYDAIATAHNRDDQAETVLYRLAKYATPRGLAGMRPRDGQLARPLLCLGADEIRAYCKERGIDYGVDHTNLEPVYARNAIRLDVLPRLAAVNPRVVETLAAGAALAAAEADVLSAAVSAAIARCGAALDDGDLAALDVRALHAEDPALQALVLHGLVRGAAGGALVERRQVMALQALCGRVDDAGTVALGGGLEAVRGGGRLRLRRRAPAHRCAALGLEGAALAAAGDEGDALSFCGRRYRLRLVPGAALDLPAAEAGDAFVGLLAPPGRVTLRHPRRGERFSPLGLGAETTAARYLAAARVPADARSRALSLEVDGQTAWLGFERRPGVGYGRVAHGYRVDQSTVCTLHLFREDT